MISTKKFIINKWEVLEFEDHILVSYDGQKRTRIVYTDKAFIFMGKNPLKFPKTIQREINGFMEVKSKAAKMGIWDVEAWIDYKDTNL